MSKPVVVAAAVLALVCGGPAAWAANADHPYTNVDHSNDAGNNTGDSKVEGLNAGQLDQNYRGPVKAMPPASGGGSVVVVPGTPAQPAPR